MFRMNGYVQDERYAAGAGRAGAARVNLAQRQPMCGTIVSISHSANQCAARLCQSRTAHVDERYIAIEHMDKVGGAGAGGLYQDALKHILWRSILGSLPRTVLIQTTRPSLSSNNMQLFEADSLESMHIAVQPQLP